MSSSAIDTEDVTRFAAGGRAVRSARLRRALIARLLSEQEEGAEEEGGEGIGGEGGDEDRQLVRLLLGSRMLRRKRLRRLLLAHLIRERGGDTEEEEFDEGDEDIGEDGGEDDRRIARLLIGSRMLRRRRVRRAVLAHLMRERGGETEDEFDEGDEDIGEEEGDRDRKFLRLLIGSRVLRRKRVRRALLARLRRDQGGGEEEEWDEDEEDIGDEGSDPDRQLARLLLAGRMAKRRRGRRALAAARFRDEND